ncbi:MAG: hypothetical protein ACYDDO_13920 [Acidiferrobacterales bacterium]
MSVIHASSRLAGISLSVQAGAAHAMAARQADPVLSLQRDHANAATVDTHSVFNSTAKISHPGLRGLWPLNLWRPETAVRKEADMKYISCPMISICEWRSGMVTAESRESRLRIP